MKIISTIALILFIPALIQAQNIEFTEYDLKNGLHVILHEDHSTPIVTVSIMYHVGSKNENPDRTGFAHFFEHLLYEGSENIERGQFDELVTAAGGMNNANTSFDRTYYYEVLPSNQLELGLYLESERLLHAKIDSIGIETQREVVKEERRQSYENRPYGSLLFETMKRAFTVHPYQWLPIGSMDHLNAAQKEEFMIFYETFYVPENAVLSIAGDIDIKDTKKLIKKYFHDIPRGENPVPRPTVVEPEKSAEIRDVVFDNIQLPAVIHAFHIPPQGTEDYYAMSMLAQLLSQGESSRLYKALVDEQQKAVYTGAFPFGTEDPGITLAYGIANIGTGTSAEVLEEAMDVEYERVRSELISEREYQKLKNQIENDLITQNSSIAGIAESLANYYMYFGNTNLINNEIERYFSVTREDIKRVANKYLKPENRVSLYYLPKSAQEKPDNVKIEEKN